MADTTFLPQALFVLATENHSQLMMSKITLAYTLTENSSTTLVGIITLDDRKD